MEKTHPQHTNRQYEEELRGLRTSLLQMGGLVERQIANAVDALVERDSELARRTIAKDAEVNRMDIDTDALCIRLLALRQPAASDLRFITTGLEGHHRPGAYRRHGGQYLRARAGAQS